MVFSWLPEDRLLAVGENCIAGKRGKDLKDGR
jgi:hypothetical protein